MLFQVAKEGSTLGTQLTGERGIVETASSTSGLQRLSRGWQQGGEKMDVWRGTVVEGSQVLSKGGGCNSMQGLRESCQLFTVRALAQTFPERTEEQLEVLGMGRME